MLKIDIFNIQGGFVDQLIQQPLAAGVHHLPWKADHLVSGLYFLTLQTSAGIHSTRMILLK